MFNVKTLFFVLGNRESLRDSKMGTDFIKARLPKYAYQQTSHIPRPMMP